jgi:hypothetical protein
MPPKEMNLLHLLCLVGINAVSASRPRVSGPGKAAVRTGVSTLDKPMMGENGAIRSRCQLKYQAAGFSLATFPQLLCQLGSRKKYAAFGP